MLDIYEARQEARYLFKLIDLLCRGNTIVRHRELCFNEVVITGGQVDEITESPQLQSKKNGGRLRVVRRGGSNLRKNSPHVIFGLSIGKPANQCPSLRKLGKLSLLDKFKVLQGKPMIRTNMLHYNGIHV